MSPQRDRCPARADGEHCWEPHEPPEWMLDEVAGWDREAWESWYDQAGQSCSACGVEDG